MWCEPASTRTAVRPTPMSTVGTEPVAGLAGAGGTGVRVVSYAEAASPTTFDPTGRWRADGASVPNDTCTGARASSSASKRSRAVTGETLVTVA